MIAREGDRAAWRFIEFFTANIRNPNTRRAYARAVGDFFRWCEQRRVRDVAQISPTIVAAFVEHRSRTHAKPTVKQELAAVRMLFDWLVVGHVMDARPAHAVRGPKHVIKRGKTPVLTREEAGEGGQWSVVTRLEADPRAMEPASFHTLLTAGTTCPSATGFNDPLTSKTVVRYCTSMAKTTAIARFTGNYQVSIPKPVREAAGLALGDFVELTAERGTIVLRPKQLTDKPIPEAVPTAAEIRALNRVIAADKLRETIPYEQYRSERAARLAGRRRQARSKTAR